MADDVYKKIKRQNGEAFARTLRNYHSGLLEIPEIVEIVRHAGRDAECLLPYLMTFLASNDNKAAGEVLDPFVLLDLAGYTAFYVDSLEKQNSIKRYFQTNELLCTFNDATRYKHYHIVHAIKKNVDEIRRADFDGQEQRQDAYGTSVISIQMLKRGGFISIKNRYNHTVYACDNTFDSNPDNIIQGLSGALKKHFNVDFDSRETSLPDNYIVFDGRIFKFDEECNNVYYGDQAWIQEGFLCEADRAAGDALFGEFLFDNKTKTLKRIDPYLADSFPDDFNRYYGGNPGLCVQNGNLVLNGEILIGAEQSRIKTLYLPEFTEMSDYCLHRLPYLTHFEAPNLIKIGDHCLETVVKLMRFEVPNLIKMGDDCLRYVAVLPCIHLPNLVSMGRDCLRFAHGLTQIEAPLLRVMSNCCFEVVDKLTEVIMPSLASMGPRCFGRARQLTRLDAPNLTKMGWGCFEYAQKLISVKLPLRDGDMNSLKLQFGVAVRGVKKAIFSFGRKQSPAMGF